ncbi:MAG: M28 family peptidase [Alphaproteobacteria bacterium]|nr:M28 family peptidase [Alphaproteobacteria bacterium]
MLLALLLPVGGCWVVTNPIYVSPDFVPAPVADAARLEADVRYLAENTPARSNGQRGTLDRAASFVADSFAAAGCEPRAEEFKVDQVAYRNVICSFGPADAPRLVIGAHYDVYESPGADDNASGVAGLIELARMIATEKPALEHRLDLVAFTLEEPPHFRTESMGSYIHAQGILKENAELKLMISVEMIGFYSDEPGSQSYPLGFLAWLYPDKADFIGVVGGLFDRSSVARVKSLMAVSDDLPVYSINAPAALTGVDFSDHWSFWQNGLPALMVTDTAFLRNPNYHEATDTPDTLDYRRMALAVDGLYQVAVSY